MLRVLHFGSTGNLGVPVLHELVSRGHEVTCFVRSETRFFELHGASVGKDIRLICGDACDSRTVDEALGSADYDAVLSTAGCVDNSVRSQHEAISSSFCSIFCNIADASERHLAAPKRAIFVGGVTALALPGLVSVGGDEVRLQELLQRRSPQYVAHVLNHERLMRSSLEWTMACPGYMVDASADDQPLRLSEDVLPVFPPDRFRRWHLAGPLRLPCVLLPVALRQGELTVPYKQVAAALVDHLEPGGRFERRLMGLANPIGRVLRKGKEERTRERALRLQRELEER